MQPVNLEEFKSGTWITSTGYKYFLPEQINREFHWKDIDIHVLLERASLKVGELNAMAHLVEDVELFIHLYAAKEAVVSSRIEGTRTSLDESFLTVQEVNPEKRDDWQEVQQYAKALTHSIEQLHSLPLSGRLIRNTHKILLDNVRGRHKLPGEFRSSQNWIGGASISDAAFIPPSHVHVSDLMGDLEHFIHNQEIRVPKLIRAGIIHYQFETIHPFLDGNGRIGRLLITLYMVSEGLLHKPLLYLSPFFESNKGLYYDNLMRVREKSDMIQWLKYFLVGVESSAAQSVFTLGEVLRLKSECEAIISQRMGKRSASGIQLLRSLFATPVVRVSDVMRITQLAAPASGALVTAFVENGILNEITGRKKDRIFMFRKYLRLFE